MTKSGTCIKLLSAFNGFFNTLTSITMLINLLRWDQYCIKKLSNTGKKWGIRTECKKTHLNPIQPLNRKYYYTIFRLRGTDTTLIYHRNIFDSSIAAMCRHCKYLCERIKHSLFQCMSLAEFMNGLLQNSKFPEY